jgi:hypothetical protein
VEYIVKYLIFLVYQNLPEDFTIVLCSKIKIEKVNVMSVRPPDIFFRTYPELTAPASGESTSVYLPPSIVAKNFSLFVTVAAINTNVIVALEGSIDGTNWSKIIANSTITANGTTHYNVANHPVKFIRPVFVSESGGTAATVLFSIAAAN